MSTEDEPRSPLGRAFDLGVYAPLGFALEFRRVVPELAEAGRRQVAFSRSLGKAALSTIVRAAAARNASPDEAPQAPAPAAASKAAAPSAKAKAKPAQKKPAKAAPAKRKPKAGEIEGYDGLTAREIIALANAASPAQRSWMLDREQDGKGRKTVLRALEE